MGQDTRSQYCKTARYLKGGDAMTKNEHEVVINRPTERVFQSVSDFATWTQWHGSGEVAKTTPGPVGVGTVWKATGEVQGQVITATVEVITHEPDSKFAVKVAGPIEAQQSFVFEPVAGGTRLVMVLELADPELAEPARQQWDKDLPKLKELLEARA
jgi:uncharacterized protein YndB with AHSA1/START domain